VDREGEGLESSDHELGNQADRRAEEDVRRLSFSFTGYKHFEVSLNSR